MWEIQCMRLMLILILAKQEELRGEQIDKKRMQPAILHK